MRIAVSTDLRTPLVDAILEDLKARGHDVYYAGPSDYETEVDWPVVTMAAVERIPSGEADEAIVLCWTGTGCSIIANKVPGIRAALCSDAETAKGARVWNHANVLALSLRATPTPVVKEILDQWFATPFSDDDWNREQIARVQAVEAG